MIKNAMKTSSPLNHVENLLSGMRDFTQKQIRLASLTLTEKGATTLSGMITALMTMFFFFFAFLFGSLSLGFFLGNDALNYAQGFLVVGGIFLIPGILILLIRRKLIQTPLANYFLRQFLKSSPENQDLTIETIHQLREEIAKLKAELSRLEQDMNSQAADLKESLRPANLLEQGLNGILEGKIDQKSTWFLGFQIALNLIRQYLEKPASPDSPPPSFRERFRQFLEFLANALPT